MKLSKFRWAVGSLTCTAITLDTTGDVGLFTSVAIGTDNYPIISYENFTNSA